MYKRVWAHLWRQTTSKYSGLASCCSLRNMLSFKTHFMAPFSPLERRMLLSCCFQSLRLWFLVCHFLCHLVRVMPGTGRRLTAPGSARSEVTKLLSQTVSWGGCFISSGWLDRTQSDPWGCWLLSLLNFSVLKLLYFCVSAFIRFLQWEKCHLQESSFSLCHFAVFIFYIWNRRSGCDFASWWNAALKLKDQMQLQ